MARAKALLQRWLLDEHIKPRKPEILINFGHFEYREFNFRTILTTACIKASLTPHVTKNTRNCIRSGWHGWQGWPKGWWRFKASQPPGTWSWANILSRYAGWNGDEWVIGVLWSSLDPLIAPKLGDLYRILEASAQVVRSYHHTEVSNTLGSTDGCLHLPVRSWS